MGLEPTIPVFEWVKTDHAVDRAAIVIGSEHQNILKNEPTVVTNL
jgi:hypothetical protein